MKQCYVRIGGAKLETEREVSNVVERIKLVEMVFPSASFTTVWVNYSMVVELFAAVWVSQ